MKELTILLETGSRIPLYQQIYEYIKEEITKGQMPAGEKLPSTRLLAKYLQVSRSTVELAYDQLLSEGYVRTVPQSGYYVCDIDTVFPEEKVRLGAESSGGLKPGAAFHLQADCAMQKKRSQTGDDTDQRICYDFSPNVVEWPDFSMNAWRKATKAMLAEQGPELFHAGDSLGEKNLRQAISSYLHQSRGVNCSWHQIIIGAGNEYLLMLLHQMLGSSHSIAMESPTYRQAYQIFCNLGWPVASVPMDEEGMMPAALRQCGAELAYVMPSHQFPLGTVMPMKRRMELLQWAGEAEGRYLIEDDHDSEFRYKGKPIPSLQGSDPYGRVIYLGTFSKSIAPAIRVSYMVLPSELLELYQRQCGFYSSTVSRIQQQILFYFMRDGYFERHLNKMRGIYRARHDALLAELKGKPWVKRVRGENAGLHILVELDTDQTEAQVIAEAGKLGVRVYGLGEYGIGGALLPGESGKNPVLLLGYAGLDETRIREGMKRLESALGQRGTIN